MTEKWYKPYCVEYPPATIQTNELFVFLEDYCRNEVSDLKLTYEPEPSSGIFGYLAMEFPEKLGSPIENFERLLLRVNDPIMGDDSAPTREQVDSVFKLLRVAKVELEKKHNVQITFTPASESSESSVSIKFNM